MTHTRWLLALTLASTLVLSLGACAKRVPGADEPAKPVPSDCLSWHSQVDSTMDKFGFKPVASLSDEEILRAFECLLMLEGRKEPARFGGATRYDVSQIVPLINVEVGALYYVSYLFTGDWAHASGVALYGPDGAWNSDETVREAWVAYRKWFAEVKAIGLDEARRRELDPLAGRDFGWY